MKGKKKNFVYKWHSINRFEYKISTRNESSWIFEEKKSLSFIISNGIFFIPVGCRMLKGAQRRMSQ